MEVIELIHLSWVNCQASQTLFRTPVTAREKKENACRLNRIIIEQGKKVLRNRVFMPAPTYRILQISDRRAGGQSTPQYCSLSAILKYDSCAYPCAVYTEYVATRLAQTLHVPVADGVLVRTDSGLAFASIVAGRKGHPLPPLAEKATPEQAAAYPRDIAALLVFDILIGNIDRGGNFKIGTNKFFGFDHSASLLGLNKDPKESIEELRRCKTPFGTHPLLAAVDMNELDRWVGRVKATPDYLIRECCVFPGQFPGVPDSLQEKLADALILRKDNLQGMVAALRPAMAPQTSPEMVPAVDEPIRHSRRFQKLLDDMVDRSKLGAAPRFSNDAVLVLTAADGGQEFLRMDYICESDPLFLIRAVSLAGPIADVTRRLNAVAETFAIAQAHGVPVSSCIVLTDHCPQTRQHLLDALRDIASLVDITAPGADIQLNRFVLS